MNNGYEQRNINWMQARARYNVAGGVKTKAELDELIAFFRARQGRAIGFRYKDFSDYKAVGQDLKKLDDYNFQLVKNYISGSVVSTRIITKPVAGTVVIYVDGVLEHNFNIDVTCGLITLKSIPLKSVSADFEFDVPVRFDTDKLSTVLDNYGSYSWQEIALVEVM